MQETCTPATPEMPKNNSKILSFFHSTALFTSPLLGGDSQSKFSSHLIIEQPTADKIIMLHYNFNSWSLEHFLRQIVIFLSTWQREPRQKEMNSFVLGQLVSHTRVQNAHLLQELPPLGSADALRSLFYHRLKRESSPQLSLSLDISFRYHLQLLTLSERKQWFCSPPWNPRMRQ